MKFKVSFALSVVVHTGLFALMIYFFKGVTQVAQWQWGDKEEVVWVTPMEAQDIIPTIRGKTGKGGLKSVSVERPSVTSAKPDETVVSLAQITSQGNERPRYPALALERGWEGRVKLKLVFEGEHPEVSVLESSGHDLLDHAALNAAKNWVLPNDLASTKLVVVPVDFEIQAD